MKRIRKPSAKVKEAETLAAEEEAAINERPVRRSARRSLRSAPEEAEQEEPQASGILPLVRVPRPIPTSAVAATEPAMDVEDGEAETDEDIEVAKSEEHEEEAVEEAATMASNPDSPRTAAPVTAPRKRTFPAAAKSAASSTAPRRRPARSASSKLDLDDDDEAGDSAAFVPLHPKTAFELYFEDLPSSSSSKRDRLMHASRSWNSPHFAEEKARFESAALAAEQAFCEKARVWAQARELYRVSLARKPDEAYLLVGIELQRTAGGPDEAHESAEKAGESAPMPPSAASVGGPASRKRDRDPNRPKRYQSSFMFFFVEQRKTIQRDRPDVVMLAEVGKLAGERWKQLTPEERRPYEEMAAADRRRFETEMVEFERTQAAAASSNPSA